MKTNELLQQFELGELDRQCFDHRAHVTTAVALLRRAPYLEAVERYVAGIQRLAAAAGVPHKFNMTVTVAFMSVIAERLDATPNVNDAEFLELNPDLLAPNFLSRWYEPARLASAGARRMFLMPEVR